MKYVIRILSDFCMNQARENGNNSYSNYIYYRTNLFITNTLHIRIILGKLSSLSINIRIILGKLSSLSINIRIILGKLGSPSTKEEGFGGTSVPPMHMRRGSGDPRFPQLNIFHLTYILNKN
jgi:hypothetical protein